MGSRFSSGAASNYAWHLWYVLVRIQEQEVEDLESSEESDASPTTPSQPSLFLFRVNPNPSLILHIERVVSSEDVRFPLKETL